MSQEKTVEWRGDKLANWMLAEIEEMRRNILKMGLEDVTGATIEDIDLSENKKTKLLRGHFQAHQANCLLMLQ